MVYLEAEGLTKSFEDTSHKIVITSSRSTRGFDLMPALPGFPKPRSHTVPGLKPPPSVFERPDPPDWVQFHRRRVRGFSALTVRVGRAGGHRSHKISPAQISDDTAKAMTLDSRSHGRTTARGLQEEGLRGCLHCHVLT